MQTGTCLSENRRWGKIIPSIGILLIPVALYFIPVEWLNRQHSICLFKNLTGHECYGCGMTRAILSSIHLQFENAFHYNKLFVIVLPILIYLWIKTFLNSGIGIIYHFQFFKKQQTIN
jgi:hypothetical protein